MGTEEIATMFRGVERLLIVGGGIGALFLGYRLFLAGIVSEQSGEFSHKSFSVKLIKVGPGIFFAVFGTFVLVSLAWAALSVGPGVRANEAKGAGQAQSQFSFLSGADKTRIQRSLEDASMGRQLFREDRMPKEAFLTVVRQMQKELARVYVGEEIYEKCETGADAPDTADCTAYAALIR